MILPLTAQVKIKEKVEIKPEGKAVIKNGIPETQNDDDSSVWPDNGIKYMQYGGELLIDSFYIPHIYDPIDSTNNLWCGDTILFNGEKIELSKKSLGTFKQWSPIQTKWNCFVGYEGKDTSVYFAPGIMYLGRQDPAFLLYAYWTWTCYEAPPEYCYNRCVENGGTDCKMERCCSSVELEYVTRPYAGWVDYEIKIDSSLAAIPPDFIMEKLGNPFTPTESWTVPCDGELFIQLASLKNPYNANYLKMTEPVDSVIVDNLGTIFGQTKSIRRLKTGEKLNIALKSGHSIVSASNMYNRLGKTKFLNQSYDGSSFCYFDFEDWTDLSYQDVTCYLIFKPDDITAFPGSVNVKAVKDTISMADTTDVIVMSRDEDGNQSQFEENKLYEVSIMEGGDYCSIYSPQLNAVSDYFPSIPAGFKVIGDVNPESPVEVLLSVGDEVEAPLAKIDPNSRIREGINTSIEKTSDNAATSENNYNRYGFCRIVIDPCHIDSCGDDWKPTEITDANFKVLGSNEDYTWVDEKGVTQTANTGNGCDYIKNNEEGMTEYGKVYLLSKMPMNGDLNSTGNYKMLDEASIDVCVDKNTGKWQTKLNNIKIPIFNSLCDIPPIISGYNAYDIKNGTTDDISNAVKYLINETNYFNSIYDYNDKRCSALNNLFLTIKNIHKGSYFQKRSLSYYVPVFSTNYIEMHEDYHVRNIKTNILNLFQNEEFSNSLNTLSLPFNPTDCPEDIKQDSKSRLQDYLTGEFIKESNLQVKHGLTNYSREPVLDNEGNVAIDENGEVKTIPLYEFASELDADMEAMIITRTILKNIEEYRTSISNCKFN